MSSSEHDQIGGETCKHYAARCDKDLHRICPSKLSKRELEDLYYSLLENNLELKRAVNGQNEKIRLLTTKVNRLTAQNKIYSPKERKDCCAGAKAVINEQKASIADLKKANECMSERIKRLNMRLCSAKQFLKKSPSQTIKCYKCFSRDCTTVKNRSTSALTTRNSDANLKTVTSSTIDCDPPITKSVETNTVEWENLLQELKPEKSCDENKCKSTMEEFKLKIIDLQEELSKSHSSHSSRIGELEQRVLRLRALADRVLAAARRGHSATEELEIQLSTERLKVAELEMRLKAADMSKEVAMTIEKHLYNANQLEEKRSAQTGKQCVCSVCVQPCTVSLSNAQTVLPTSSKFSEETAVEDRQTVSDDSGYAENHLANQKDGSISKLNQELANKIAHLQEQLDHIKSLTVPNKSEFDSYETVVKDSEVPVLKNVKDCNCLITDPKSKVVVEIAHVNKDVIDYGDESIDSDIEGHYNEKVRTREQGSMKSESRSVNIQSEKPIESEQDNLYIESSHVSLNVRRSTREERDSLFTPKNVAQDVRVNDAVKPLKEYECLDQNDLLTNKDEYDYSVDQTPIKENGDTKTIKCKKVICKCPKCDSEPKKNTETPVSQMESPAVFESKLCQSPSQDHIVNVNAQLRPPRIKPDTHNSLQIPGPIPTSKRDSTSSKISKATNKLELSKAKMKLKNIVGSAVEKSETSEHVDTDKEISGAVKYGKSVGTTSNFSELDNVSTIGENIPEKETTVQNTPVTNLEDTTLNDTNAIKIKNSSTLEDKSANVTNEAEDEKDTEINQQKTFSEHQLFNDVVDIARESRTAKKVKRLTESANEKRGYCTRGREANKTEKRLDTSKTLDNEPCDPGNTYTVSPEHRSRATTPDNTECEISSMSDLPTEKEGTNTRRSLSPGEHKMTSTSDSYTPCHWSSLSEGEVPHVPKQPKKLSTSVGEHPGDERSSTKEIPESTAAQMEAALQAISRELTRCRAMLQARPTDVTYGHPAT